MSYNLKLINAADRFWGELYNSNMYMQVDLFGGLFKLSLK